MDPIEKAIRNALEKGDAGNRAFREKVYRSAFAALDRALQANPGVTVETAINRRKAMQAKVAEIEMQFLPPANIRTATSQDSENPGINAPEEPSVTPQQPDESTFLNTVPSRDTAASSDHVIPVVPDIIPEGPLPRTIAKPKPDRAPRQRRPRKRGLPALFSILTLLAVIGLGAWWLLQSGALRTAEQRGEVPVPPATVEDEDFSPSGTSTPLRAGQETFSGEWITVFSPLDPTTVSSPADASAQVMEDDSGTFLRLRSGASGSAISFDVGQGILDEIAGTHAVFVLVARAEDSQTTQIAIDCNFGELGDCGRKRYEVGRERNEYLFDVQLPDKRAGAAGTIAINSDVDNQGKAIDIYEIRVSPNP
ncbi:hypothetical protein ACFPLB_07960 [Aquamicrobium segne]|uniref:Uncharacterized protein n=1 Tax=Aquamicrobium segne TaxID=469547 RepID=A0ABW0GZT0_9HYPH